MAVSEQKDGKDNGWDNQAAGWYVLGLVRTDSERGFSNDRMERTVAD